jgi:putative membrane protein
MDRPVRSRQPPCLRAAATVRVDKRRASILLALAAMGLLAPRVHAADPPRSGGGLTGGARKVSDGDNVFLRSAAQAGLYEVEVSRRAAQRARSPQVKQFARMLVEQHTASNDQLRRLAASKDVQLPNDMPEEKKQKLAALEKHEGAAFDTAFVREVGIAEHRAGIELFQDAARSAEDADIKTWANLTLRVLREHLAVAQGMSARK